jgi:hypothetical protein
MAVCPAGEDVIGPYLASKKDFADDVMRPLQAKREPIYVVRGSEQMRCRSVIPVRHGKFAARNIAACCGSRDAPAPRRWKLTPPFCQWQRTGRGQR